LGQPLLIKIGTLLSGFPNVKAQWVNTVQMGMSWRVIRWHNGRFARRALNRLAGHWDEYDMAYVHSDSILAAQLSRHLPTCLRLPGPLGSSYAPFLHDVNWVCAHGDALSKLQSLFENEIEIHELPIGLDTQHFSPTGPDFRASIGWDDSSIVLGYVGRIITLKGMQVLASAFCQVATDIPELRLLLVGDGAETNAILKEFRKAGIEDRVYFAGIQTHDLLPAWYRSMDFFIMPSLYETLSHAVLEAMGCGLPVIASAVGGNVTAVPAQTGWLFEPGNSHDLTRVLRIAVGERHLWSDMGSKARVLVENQYSWLKTASVFENLVSEHRISR
jgi:glycosyltransferase involved in cell wall biosynthesis